MKIIIFSLSLILLFSCNSSNELENELTHELDKRIELLEKSFRYVLVTDDLFGPHVDSLLQMADELCRSESKDQDYYFYKSIRKILSHHEIVIKSEAKNKTEMLLQSLIGLDEVIFKYNLPRISFSDLKTIITANTHEPKFGKELNLQIYIAAFDSLYWPEFLFFDKREEGKIIKHYLPGDKGIGQFNVTSMMPGKRNIEGAVVLINEQGSRDTIPWEYQYEFK